MGKFKLFLKKVDEAVYEFEAENYADAERIAEWSEQKIIQGSFQPTHQYDGYWEWDGLEEEIDG